MAVAPVSLGVENVHSCPLVPELEVPHEPIEQPALVLLSRPVLDVDDPHIVLGPRHEHAVAQNGEGGGAYRVGNPAEAEGHKRHG